MVLSFAFLLVKPFTWQNFCSIRYGVITVLIIISIIKIETKLLALYAKAIKDDNTNQSMTSSEANELFQMLLNMTFNGTNQSMTSTKLSDA